MNRRLNDTGVISLSSDSDDADRPSAPVAGPSNARAHRRARTSGAASAAVARSRGSAELDVPHALDDASRTQLQVAIAIAPEARVREAFAALVDSVPAVTERVFAMLVGDRDRAQAQEQVAAVAPPAAAPYRPPSPLSQAARERAAAAAAVPQWQVCARCGNDYDEDSVRLPTECSYHPGKLAMNYDAWPDWDEDVHGPMDTRENRRQYPENFTWSCCRRDGTRAGCVFAEHGPVEGPRRRQKRARLH